MRLAVTAAKPDLDAEVDPRFGRCPYFIVVETNDLSFEVIENASQALGQGAGIQSARTLAACDVQYVLTGNCGPNAHQTLTAAEIGVVVGCVGSVRNVVEAFNAGSLVPCAQPNVSGHSGMPPAPSAPEAPSAEQGPRPGGGAGRGMGGGMGRGRGGGHGHGGGRGRGGGRRAGGGGGR